MFKFLPIMKCVACNIERPYTHKVCTECGAILAHGHKPNPDYIIEYNITNVCNKCGRSDGAIKDHIGKFCPNSGGEFTIVEHKEEIIFKGGEFNPASEYPF